MIMQVDRRGLVAAFASIVLVSVAQLCMKYGLLQLPDDFQLLDELNRFLQNPASSLTRLWPVLASLAVGIAGYGASVLCWMHALRYLRLSFAYPLLSLSYLLVQVAVILIPAFNESLHTQRVIGIVIVMVGIGLCVMPGAASERDAHH